MTCKNEYNVKSLKSTQKTFQCPRYVYKRLSAQSRNIFTRVYCAFTVINILNIITCPLAILLNILVHDSRRKNKSDNCAPNQTSRSLVWLRHFFRCGTDFFNLRDEKQITPMPAEMTSFKPHAHEESEVESYLS